jgi:hypothetical protein
LLISWSSINWTWDSTNYDSRWNFLPFFYLTCNQYIELWSSNQL